MIPLTPCATCKFNRPEMYHKEDISIPVCLKWKDGIDWKIIDGKVKCEFYKES